MLLCGNKEYSISFTVASHYTYKKWLVSLPTSVASIEYLTSENPTITKSINFFLKLLLIERVKKVSFCLRKILFTDQRTSFHGGHKASMTQGTYINTNVFNHNLCVQGLYKPSCMTRTVKKHPNLTRYSLELN